MQSGRERSWEGDPPVTTTFRSQKNERRRLKAEEKKQKSRVGKPENVNGADISSFFKEESFSRMEWSGAAAN